MQEISLTSNYPNDRMKTHTQKLISCKYPQARAIYNTSTQSKIQAENENFPIVHTRSCALTQCGRPPPIRGEVAYLVAG